MREVNSMTATFDQQYQVTSICKEIIYLFRERGLTFEEAENVIKELKEALESLNVGY